MTSAIKELDRNFPYQNRYALDDSFLEESIKRHGILEPLLGGREDGRTFILSGHKRLVIAEKLGLKEIPLRFCDEVQDQKRRFLLALLSNWGQKRHELDVFQASIKALSQYQFTEEEYLQQVLPAMGIAPQKNIMAEVLKIQALEEMVREAIAKEDLPYRGAAHLLKFPAEDQTDFVRLVAQKLNLSVSQLQQSVEWLYDLMRHNKVSLKDCLRKTSLKEILDHEKWDARQKTDAFMAGLRRLRTPRLVKKEEAFSKLAADTCRSVPGLKIEAPPYFEKQGYSLQMQIDQQGSLDALRQVLEKERTSFNALLDCVL